MATIRLTKIEAARRQINAGIRMLFSGEDPAAIHTVAMAAFRIVRDLTARQGDSYMHQVTKAMIRPGMEKEFWNILHGPANFLKHADLDADAVLEGVEEEVNDSILLIASMYYLDLAHQLTSEMTTLWCWCMALHPNFLNSDAVPAFGAMLPEARKDIVGKTRKEQLAIGNNLLEAGRRLYRNDST